MEKLMEGFEGFSGGTARERNLLIGLGAVALIFVIWLLLRAGGGGGGIEPAQPAASADLGGDIDTALRELQTVETTLASRPATAAVPNTNRAPLERQALVQRAQGAGLIISQLEPEADGAVSLTFDAVGAPVVMRFLRDVETSVAAEITELDISASDDAKVEATVLFSPTGAQ